MAGNTNMNLNASLRLNASQFKKGIADVQRSLRGLQSTFLSVAGALGAGLGLSRLLSDLKNTAVQLNAAQITLKNVSKEYGEYGENLEFIRKISNKYGQDQLILTESFAKFRAAASSSNLELSQMRDIYEALTKAAGAYQLSSEQTRNVMMAVEQMLSKGKVAAEELRRQLGNSLPGAFNLMAKAAGLAGITVHGTTAELEKAMKAGKVSSEQILPHFAKVLNEITETANFNSLQNSINRLKNSWVSFTEASGFDKFYKGIVDGTNGLISFLGKNMRTLKSILLGAFVGLPIGSAFKNWEKKGTEYYDTLTNKAKALNRQVETLSKKLETASGQYQLEKYHNDKTGFDYRAAPLRYAKGVGAQWMEGSKQTLKDADRENIIKYNRALAELEKTEKQLGITRTQANKTLYAQSEAMAKAAGKTYDYTVELTRAQKIQRGAMIAWNGFTNAVKTALASIGMGLLISGIVAGLTLLISKFVEARKEAKELANIVPDMEKKVNDVSDAVAHNDTAQKLTGIVNAIDAIKDSSNKIDIANKEALIGELNKTLGRTGDKLLTVKSSFKEIEGAVNDYIAKLSEAARQQAIIATVGESTAQIVKLQQENLSMEMEKATISPTITKMYGNGYTQWEEKNPRLTTLENQIDKNIAKIGQLKEGIKKLTDMADEDTKKTIMGLGNTSSGSTNNNDFGDEKKLKGIPKIMEDYKNAVDELNASLSQGVITQEEYEKELNKLIIDTWRKAAKTGKLDINTIMEKVDKGQTLTAMEKWYYDIAKAAKMAAKNVILEEMVKDTVKDLTKLLEQEIESAIDDLDKDIERKLEAETIDFEVKTKTKRPQFEPRSSLLDYGKDNSDILKEEVDKQKEWAKDIEDYIEDIKNKYKDISLAGKDVQEELAAWEREMIRATAAAESLEAAMRYEKIKEDIKDLNKTIADSYASGLKGLASDMDRIVKGWESIKDAMDDEDTSYWDKFMLVFNEIVQIFDAVVGVIDTFNKIQEASAKLAGAELAQNAALIEMQQKKVSLERELFIWKQKNAGMTNAAIAAEIAEATAARSNASAKASEAVAGATASGAKLAFPWNLAAIAVGVATVLAALTGGKNIKFANGGIVGGNSYSGDNQLARVNSGEMILNRGQQSKLFKMINSGGMGGKVEFEIRGDRLKGVLKNYDMKMKG